MSDDPLNPGQLALFVGGTDAADNIQVRSGRRGQIEVKVNNGCEHFAKSFNGPLSRVVVYGLDGDDHIQVENQLGLIAWLYGGEGDDHIQTGAGPSMVLGGAGDDHIDGHGGLNVLIGGIGADQIQAGSLGDILIHGTTDHDTNDAALNRILMEWNSPLDTYFDRVEKLSSWLNDSTVNDDEDGDHLLGSRWLDWFFASLGDQVTGAMKGEQVMMA